MHLRLYQKRALNAIFGPFGPVFNCRCTIKETNVSEQSVYKPSRAGARAIPLSFTGRHLLQSLREAIIDAISDGDFMARGGAVSNARERIAQYMSDLERKKGTPEVFFLHNVSDTQLLDECEKRGIGRVKLAPGLYETVRERRPRVVNVIPPWQLKLKDYEVTVDTAFNKVRFVVQGSSYDDALRQARAEYPTYQDTSFTLRKL